MYTSLYYLLNFSVVIACLLPLCICLYETRNHAVNRSWGLFIAFCSLIIGAIEFAWLNDGLNLMSKASTQSDFEYELKINIVKAFGIWVFALPAIYLAISANLFTHFIITNKSNNA